MDFNPGIGESLSFEFQQPGDQRGPHRIAFTSKGIDISHGEMHQDPSWISFEPNTPAEAEAFCRWLEMGANHMRSLVNADPSHFENGMNP